MCVVNDLEHCLVSSFAILPAPAKASAPTKAATTASTPAKSTPTSAAPEHLLLLSVRSHHRTRRPFRWHSRRAQSRLVGSRKLAIAIAAAAASAEIFVILTLWCTFARRSKLRFDALDVLLRWSLLSIFMSKKSACFAFKSCHCALS